jgi:hypothetical protein
VFIDYDNDGDQDLYVTAWGGNTLWQNQLVESGTATFNDVTTTAGLADFGRNVTTAWGDFNGDGFLDVYMTKHFECMPIFPANSEDTLYESNGDGTFTDVTPARRRAPRRRATASLRGGSTTTTTGTRICTWSMTI